MPNTAILKPRGFTLPELLVGFFLASLLLTILVRVASLTYRIGHEEIARASLEERAVLITSKLERDILDTAAAGLTLSQSLNRVILNPITGLTPEGKKIFAGRLVFWSHGESIVAGRSDDFLIRSEITEHETILHTETSGALGSPIRLLPDELAALSIGQGKHQTHIYADVEHFEVKPQEPLISPQVGASVLVRVDMNLALASTRKTVRIERVVTMRSSGV